MFLQDSHGCKRSESPKNQRVSTMLVAQPHGSLRRKHLAGLWEQRPPPQPTFLKLGWSPGPWGDPAVKCGAPGGASLAPFGLEVWRVP